MANSLDKDLTGKVVIVNDNVLNRETRFLCESGFGCKSFTAGTKIFGKFLDLNNTEGMVRGYDVIREAKSEKASKG